MTLGWFRVPLALSLLVALGAAGCGDDDGDDTASSAAPSEGEPELDGTITVFAAASLTDAFSELGEAFEDEHSGASVELNFAASSALREQILAGAPADVFASANESNMTQVADADATAGEPVPFVANKLAIAVPAGNPGGVDGLEDFADRDLLIGLCAEEVPCGEFGREALANAGVEAGIDTNEPDVRSLLTKIEVGDLDAGIVYHTDVLAAGDPVEGVEIPADQNVTATYPIAVLADAGRPDVAQAFVDFVVSHDGQEILESYGFEGLGAS
jgi:molybdate transport system substrate-binding protein